MALGLAIMAAPVWAQSGPPDQAGMPIATLDQEALFSDSAFGRRVQAGLDRDRDALAAENRRIEADLRAEEQRLTEQRPTMPPAEFSVLARAFDEKVQRIRAEQTEKSRQLQMRLEEERQVFLQAVAPVLAELMQSRGAVALIDRAAILLAFEGIDITEAAIAAIDSEIGSGAETGIATPPGTGGGARAPEAAPSADGGGGARPGTPPAGPRGD